MERNTKIENEMLKNLIIDNNTVQIKLFMTILNKAISKHYAQGEYIEEVESELNLSMDFVKKYKGDKNLTTREIMNFIKDINVKIRFYDEEIEENRVINVIREFQYNDYDFIIKFDEEAIKYVVLVANNYTLIDLEVLKHLKGKYEIGLYVIQAMYKKLKHKKKIFELEEFKKFIGIKEKKVTQITDGIDKAINKLEKLGINVDYELYKRGRKISDITFMF